MVRKYRLRPRPTARVDRFSVLPDEVAHHILAFLTFLDLVRVSAVSKTCRRFYLSIPSLEINRYDLSARRNQEEVHSMSLVDLSARIDQEEEELLNCLDRYFINRGDNRIQHFHIHWSFYRKPSNKQFQVNEWIQNAVRCGIEVLDINFSAVPPLFVMPSSVFVSQSLRSLSVCLHGVILQAPSSSLLCNLQHLKLRETKIVDESVFKWISCSCKSIKELELDQIRGLPTITIESSSLKSFKVWSKDLFHLNIFGEKIEDIHITWRKFYPPPSTKWLNISAPNLKNLKWEGNVTNIQNLGKFMSLGKAVVFLESAVNEFDNVFKVICSICRAKVVILNEWTIKALTRERIIPTPFDDLRCFSVEVKNLNDDIVPAMVYLLREMPNLNTLQIQCTARSGVANSRCSGIDMEFWKLQNLAFIYQQLKEATLWLSNGSNGIELAKYILEHAQNLEKMVIFHLFKDSDVVRELKNKMISDATVVSHVRKDERENYSESTVDRFSNLPNEIAHHILSTLSFKDVIRLGCVSKRCRGLQLSSPSVNFCDFSDVNNQSSCEVRKSLLDSFGRYLNQRRDKKIRCFRFSWSAHFLGDIFDDDGLCYCECHLQLRSWIDIAVRCNVEVVQLIYASPDWHEFLPSSLFLCKSLKSLIVGVKGFIGEMTSLSNLEYLKLSNVIVKEEFWKWFSQSCKCIKELHLDQVSGCEDIIIDSTSLESFSFEEFILGGDCCNLDISGDRLEKLVIKWVARPNSSFKISAPKLKLLEWYGNFASQQQFEELPCLQVAYISSFLEEVNHLTLFDLLCTIRRIKALIMSESILKVFLMKERFMSLRLDCVRCLWLQNLVVTDDLIPAMISLRGALPNLSC